MKSEDLGETFFQKRTSLLLCDVKLVEERVDDALQKQRATFGIKEKEKEKNQYRKDHDDIGVDVVSVHRFFFFFFFVVVVVVACGLSHKVINWMSFFLFFQKQRKESEH